MALLPKPSFSKSKQLLTTQLLKPRTPHLNSDEVTKALEYINGYWDGLRRYNPDDKGMMIGLPHEYIVPSSNKSASFVYDEQFYWDSYFIALGLLDESYEPLVSGMLENMLHLLRRFGMIPNASAMYQMSHSQPPILTTHIFYVYERYGKSAEWLANHMAMAEQEYHTVWMGTRQPHWRLVHKGLNRYYDVHVQHDMAEAESGWDMTPRFERKCLDYLPVDLNSLLYKYEKDFARSYDLMGDHKTARTWGKRAEVRKDAMDKLMWGKLRGFYFDYNYYRKELGGVWSLAGFYPMWVGMASKEQAARMVENLIRFEKIGGLVTTTRPLIDMSIFGSLKTQWAYPNGWAPLHYIVIEALENYGYHEEAGRIAKKWLKTNLEWFKKHHHFQEKYNVVSTRKHPVEGLYPSQTGFGWTNAVFAYLAEKYIKD